MPMLAILWCIEAYAKVEGDSPYTLNQTFGAALRLLRVDLGLEVTEKDPEASYLLFHYRLLEDPKRVIDGAIELIALPNRVKIIVKIPQLPESHERLLRDRLVRKLRDDFGEPPRRPEPKPPDAPPDKPDKDKPDKDKPDKP
jgi:hypothetical protein